MKFAYVLFFALVPFYALGGQTASPGDTWLEHPDIVRYIISGLFLLLGFFLVRTLTKFDKAQDLLFENDRKLADRIATLEGRCEANHD